VLRVEGRLEERGLRGACRGGEGKGGGRGGVLQAITGLFWLLTGYTQGGLLSEHPPYCIVCLHSSGLRQGTSRV